MIPLSLLLIPGEFCVCKLASPPGAEALVRPFHFFARTDDEISLVCPSLCAPESCVSREDGFRLFRARGTLDFSLVGILARISGALADAGVGLFALSTYDTDYILVRADALSRAARALLGAGYTLEGAWEANI